MNKLSELLKKYEEKKDLSNELTKIISSVVNIQKIPEFGRSRRFRILKNNKNFIVKHRSEITNNRYFFGIGKKISETFNYQNCYVILVCASLSKVIVLPAHFIFSHLLKTSTAKDNEWKFNIIESFGNYSLEIPKLTKVDVTEFLNSFSQFFDKEEIITINNKINNQKETVASEPKSAIEIKELNNIELINKEEQSFFKLTTQEQIYDLKVNQIKILKLIEQINP